MLRYYLIIMWLYTELGFVVAAPEDTPSAHSVLSAYQNAIGLSKIDRLNAIFWTRTASIPGLLYMPAYHYQKQSPTTDTTFSAIHFLGKKLFASVSEDGKGGHWFICFLSKKKSVPFLKLYRKGNNKKERNKDPIRYVYSDLVHLSNKEERDLLGGRDTLFTYEGTRKKKKQQYHILSRTTKEGFIHYYFHTKDHLLYFREEWEKKKKKDGYNKSLVRYKKYRNIQGIRYPSVLRQSLLKSKTHIVIWNASDTDAVSRYPPFALLQQQLNALSDKHP